MIDKASDSSSAVHPFRPPKSPSSILVHKNTHVSPKSPTHRRKTRKDMQNKPTSTSHEAPSDVLSPTSVLDPRGLFREQRRTRQGSRGSRRDGPGSNKPNANEADISLVEAGNQCIQVRNQRSRLVYFSSAS